MPCTCKRLTLRYACRHKEREYDRCWRYQFRKDYPCFGSVIGDCEAEPARTNVLRVCNRCFDFFFDTFGKRAAYHVSRKFLEYKENNGLRREVIEPETVPPEAYISTGELASLDPKTPYWRGQPFRPRTPMTATHPRDLPPTPPRPIRSPEPVVHRNRHGDRGPLRSKSRSKSRSRSGKRSKKAPIPRKPLPSRKLSKKDISGPILQKPLPDIEFINSMPTGGSDFQSFPAIPDNAVLEHRTNQPLDLSDLIDDEDDDELEERSYPPMSPKTLRKELMRHRNKHAPRRSAVYELHHNVLGYLPLKSAPINMEALNAMKAAQKGEPDKITGIPNPEGKDLPCVPKLENAPKVPAWRVDIPSSKHSKPTNANTEPKSRIPIPRSQSAGPALRSQKFSPVPSIKVPASATATYLARSRRPSREQHTASKATPVRTFLQVPPLPPTAGLNGFLERGLPSAAFAREENFGDKIPSAKESPDVLLSVSTISPAYSCAVQSCYCSESGEGENLVCPSCTERQRLESQLHAKWL
ncbi:hypothetical protein F4806DRAFT_130156 [Annulohypoxylon nitens]|nr:hypothetical protein F4806DRAFT_130156 [Annulohypoxylon nitens]